MASSSDEALEGCGTVNNDEELEAEAKRMGLLGNEIPERLPRWVKRWGEGVNEAWTWQWEADAPERDHERAVEMLRLALLGAGAGG